MNTSPASNHQNFIGNEITNSDILKGLYMLNGSEHFEYGNNLRGSITPAGTEELTDPSYYLYKTPEWYKTNSFYPPIGTPNKINQFDNEAKTRYLAGNFTACEDMETEVPFKRNTEFDIFISPNPASDNITLTISCNDDYSDELVKIDIINTLGYKVKESDMILQACPNRTSIDLNDLADGVYFIVVSYGNRLFSEKFIHQKK